MINNSGAAFNHLLQRFFPSLKVGYQALHQGSGGLLLDGQDSPPEVLRPAIRKVVPGHRGQDRVLDPHLLDRCGDPFRFIGLQGARRTGRDGAKSAISGAAVAHHQEGGSPPGETFALVGTSGFLTDGMQGVLLN
jgi:hypothetical protein